MLMLLWSRVGGPLLSACCCGQGLVVRYYHHVAVVRGWWSAIVIMLLWSGVGGELFSSCCCGHGLVVSCYHHVAVVRGWWSATILMLVWSGVGGQLRTRSLRTFSRSCSFLGVVPVRKPLGYVYFFFRPAEGFISRASTLKFVLDCYIHFRPYLFFHLYHLSESVCARTRPI